jgi:HEPN domain-containing protein
MWFSKAIEDKRAAQLLLAQNSEIFFGAVVFHSQQAAEKSIKGYLAFNKIRFSKTHDLDTLINLISQIDASLAIQLKPAVVLTKFATAYRYPEEVEPPEPLTLHSCQKTLDLANMVFDEMQSRVTKEP